MYEFSEGSRAMRDLLGGKGANLAEMTRVLGADRVPPGFTITTEACVVFLESNSRLPDGLADQVDEAVEDLGAARRPAARGLGRSPAGLGALGRGRLDARHARHGPQSRPERILGRGLAARTADERFAFDSFRRFVQMFGNVVCGIPGQRFEEAIAEEKSQAGVVLDTELDADRLRALKDRFEEIYSERTGEDFPEDPQAQLWGRPQPNGTPRSGCGMERCRGSGRRCTSVWRG